MVMKEFINSFPSQIDTAIKLADSIKLNIDVSKIDKIVIYQKTKLF